MAFNSPPETELRWKGYSIQICVDGQPLALYRDPNTQNPDSATTRYLEGLPGKKFVLNFKRHVKECRQENEQMDYEVAFDGAWGVTYAAQSGPFNHVHRHHLVLLDRSNELQWIEPCFADLLEAGSGKTLSSGSDASLFGSIQIRMWRGTTIPVKPYLFDFSGSRMHTGFDERAVKGRQVDQRILALTTDSAKQSRRTMSPNYRRQPYPGPEGEPQTLTFRYCSRRMLQSMGIFPKPNDAEVSRNNDVTNASETTIKRETKPSLSTMTTPKSLKRERCEMDTDDDDVQISEYQSPKKAYKVTTTISLLDED